MSLLSLGLWPDEARRMGRVVRHDFVTNFVFVTAAMVGTRLLVWFVHGQ